MTAISTAADQSVAQSAAPLSAPPVAPSAGASVARAGPSGDSTAPFLWPEEGLSRIPFQVYNDPAIADAEQKRLFRGPIWNLVCLDVEIPQPGDYRTNVIGDTPVVAIRGTDGTIRVFVNRCAHRGSMLCLDKSGNRKDFTCIYHNWVYDLEGALQSVAFRRGIRGQGGLPDDFDPAKHGLTRLRVDTIGALVFASFSESVVPVREWLGERMAWNVDRIFAKPVRILGGYTQVMHNNWKLYIENVKDAYHAGLLHLFFTRFGLNRLSMDGAVEVSERGGHHLSWSKMHSDDASGTEYADGKLRSMKDFDLEDKRMLRSWVEYPDGITHMIQTIFPNVIIQQIQNSLAVRLLVPHGTDQCELQWWLIGYESDTEAQMATRLLQGNLVGPAGLVSLEDGVIGSIVQRTTLQDKDRAGVVEMGGHGTESQKGRVSEAGVRGFWKEWRQVLGL